MADELDPETIELLGRQAWRLVDLGMNPGAAASRMYLILYQGVGAGLFTCPADVERKVTEIILTAARTGLPIEYVAGRWRYLDEVQAESGVLN